ncbi:hypothetical protein [Caldithrix abyssi]
MKTKGILIFIFLIQLAFAQSGRYAASFLELGVGARTMGMGSAGVAATGQVTAPFWNPAGLAMVERLQAGSMYANLFNKLEQQSYFGFVLPVMKNSVVGISWMRLSIDEIPRYDFDEDSPITAYQRLHGQAQQLTYGPVDYFSNQNDVFIFTFARLIPTKFDLGWQYFEIPVKFGFGLNLKYISQQLDRNKATGIGIDIGWLMSLNLNDIFAGEYYGVLNFGLNVQDLAETRMVWDTESRHVDRLKRNFKYGVQYTQPLAFLDSDLILAYDVNTKYDGNTHLGAELLIKSLFALRVGSNFGHLTAGAGLLLWKFRVNYAFQGHDLGNSHRVSLTLVF